MPATRFRAEVVAIIPLDVASASAADAETLARQIATARPWLHESHIVDVTVAPLTIEQQLDADNRRLWQEIQAIDDGTVSQRERWRANALPESELLALVRPTLYLPFAAFPRWRKLTLSHRAGCTARPLDGAWTVLAKQTFTVGQWKTLSLLKRHVQDVHRHPWMIGAGDAVRLHPRDHTGTCEACKATAHGSSVQVNIEWAGRTLTREYTL